MPNTDHRHDLQENLQENIHDLQQELLQMQEELNKRLEELRAGKFSFRRYTREHPYILLFLYLPVYLVWFFFQEYHLASTAGCFVSYLPLDDQIPFLPGFIFPYITWYVYLLVPAIVFLVKEDGAAFTRYALFIILGFSGSLLFCALFPNCQLLRADLSDPQNLSEFLVAAIYGADTPTNVLPSMHVVGCIGVIAAAFDGEHFRRGRWFLVLWGIAISVSTVFVKQHSILDLLAGVGYGFVLYLLLYVLLRKPLNRIGKKHIHS